MTEHIDLLAGSVPLESNTPENKWAQELEEHRIELAESWRQFRELHRKKAMDATTKGGER